MRVQSVCLQVRSSICSTNIRFDGGFLEEKRTRDHSACACSDCSWLRCGHVLAGRGGNQEGAYSGYPAWSLGLFRLARSLGRSACCSKRHAGFVRRTFVSQSQEHKSSKHAGWSRLVLFSTLRQAQCLTGGSRANKRAQDRCRRCACGGNRRCCDQAHPHHHFGCGRLRCVQDSERQEPTRVIVRIIKHSIPVFS